MDNIEDLEGFNEAWKPFERFLTCNNFGFWQKCLILQLIDKLYEKVDDTLYAKSLELKEVLNSIGYFDYEDIGIYKRAKDSEQG